jgi:hypothetical protein
MSTQTSQKAPHYPRRIFLTALLILLILCKICYAQTNELSDLTRKFEHFSNNDLQEKLFVHTDKNFYLAGEIMWLKVYDICEATNAPFDFSKVAYVELLDQNNTPVLRAKIPLRNTRNGASLFLPYNLRSGSYTFRAYTSWMRNFLPGYYFEKTITIVNTTKSNDLPEEAPKKQYEVQFFPEGGYLVNGLRSEVGFDVADQYGNDPNYTGAVVNQQNDTIIRFRPYKFGIGHFYFTPDEEDHYKAIISIRNGPTISSSLPAVKRRGLVMHLQSTPDDQVAVTVYTNESADRFCYLIIHTRESVKVAEVLSFKNGQATFNIDQNKLGGGISQFTIFNRFQQPVCERLFFKQPKRKLIIHAETDQQSFALRQPVLVHFHVNDENHKQAKADISVSVYKLDTLQRVDQSNILHYIWLNSELKGRIESSAYYFQNNNDSINQAADNLMLTQGWRRFRWSNVLQNKVPVIQYPPELSGPIISGKVTDSRTGSPASSALIYLSILGRSAKVQGYQTSNGGRFYFNMKNFYGTHEIIAETNTQSKDSADQITVFSAFSDKYSNRPAFKPQISPSAAGELYDHNLWTQVQHAYHPDIFTRFTTIPADTSAFFGKPSKTYWLDDYIRYTTMEEVMKEYVQEVAVRVKDRHYRFMVVNNYDKSVSSSLFTANPFITIDGIPVFNVDKVIALDPLKVQKLDVVTGRYFYGPIVADGILSYTTYKGDMGNFPLDPRSVIINYNGLQRDREFYSPKYTVEKGQSSRIPDFRNVLYWSSDIRTDSEGNARCSFYTSDISGQYIVVVNGISKDGRAGHTAIKFRVRSNSNR